MWGFSTEPEFQRELDWIDEFVREEVEPADFIVPNSFDLESPVRAAVIPPLQQQVKDRGLWAAHLGPELGGQGFGQVKLALMNEILGRSRCAPIVFGSQAPDSGNAEILAHFGTDEHKERFLAPLLDGRIVSCFSMTEPQGGADPKVFTTTAVQDGDDWVINGEKWFSSHARFASFLVVMAVTDPDAEPYRSMSMLIVPSDTPGVEIVRNVAYGDEPEEDGDHAYVRYSDVRVPAANLLGERGAGFAVAQTRLGGGRVHHAMRTVGAVNKAFDLMCERALSRQTQGELLARKQLVQDSIADSWIEIEQFRLFVLKTAWLIDEKNDYKQVRKEIAAVKALMPKVYADVVGRAMHLHGALGVSGEMPFAQMLLESFALSVADGPTEVHKITIARELLKHYEAAPDLFPSGHLPRLRELARSRYADVLAAHEAQST